jgi:hypothetical protein
MNEHEFHDPLRDGLGELPPLAAPVLASLKSRRPRAHRDAMTVIAFLLAALLVLVLVGYRMSFRQRGETLPATSANPVAQPAPASFTCALPVVATSWAAYPGPDPVMKVSAGFVNIPSGELWVDPAATLQDLPSDTGGLWSATYSSPLKRWLPADSRTVSPDGRSYVYVKWLPEDAPYSRKGVTPTSTELHVVNAAKKTDQKLWSTADLIGVDRWDSHGILVNTSPTNGRPGQRRIDPATGRVTQAPSDAEQASLPVDALQQSGIMSMTLGQDKQGRAVFRIGARDLGTKYSVVVVESGRATTIYSGVAGDATDFDPGGVYSDGHGLWLGNDDGSRVWLWTKSAGLRSFKVTGLPPAPEVTGLPPAPSGYKFYNVSLGPAGECVPGQFDGVALVPLPPPPTPSPSPIPSPVDSPPPG